MNMPKFGAGSNVTNPPGQTPSPPKAKPSGMEMLMTSAFKGLGLNPEEIKGQVGQYGNLVVQSLETLRRIEAQNAEILRTNNLILNLLQQKTATQTGEEGNGST